MPEYNSPTAEEIKRQQELFRAQQKEKTDKFHQNLKEQPEQELGDSLSEQENAERLNKMRMRERIKAGVERARRVKEKVDKVKGTQEKLKKAKNIYRIINGTSAITFVGLIVTFFVMNTQFSAGNVFKSKFIPKLDWWEIGILALVWLIIIVAILLIFFIIYMITHPCEALEFTGFSFLKGLCDNIIKTSI